MRYEKDNWKQIIKVDDLTIDEKNIIKKHLKFMQNLKFGKRQAQTDKQKLFLRNTQKGISTNKYEFAWLAYYNIKYNALLIDNLINGSLRNLSFIIENLVEDEIDIIIYNLREKASESNKEQYKLRAAIQNRIMDILSIKNRNINPNRYNITNYGGLHYGPSGEYESEGYFSKQKIYFTKRKKKK